MLSYNPSVPSIDESATKCLDQRSPSPYKFNKLDSSQPKDNLGKINTSDQLPATTTTTLIESTASPYHSVDSINRSAASAGLRNSTARSDSALTSNSSLRAPRRTCPNPSLSRHLNRPVSSQRPINNPSFHQPTPRATLSSSSPSSSPSPSSSAVSSPTFSFSRVSTPISLLSPTSSLPGDPSLHLAQAGRKTSLYRGSSSKPNLTQPPLCELLEEEKEAFSLTEAISNKPGEKNHSSLGLDSSVNRTSLKCEKPVLAQLNPKNINLSSPLDQPQLQPFARMKTPSPGFQSPPDKTPTSQAHLSRVASPDTAQLSSLPPNWPAVDKKNDTSCAIENGQTQSRSPSARCAKLSRSGSPKQPVKETKARRTPSAPLRVPIEPGHCLVFGRKPDTSAISSEVTPKSTLLPIILPKSFNHASRTHCLCTLIAPPLGGLNIRIVVKGQNGLMVDGERFEAGSSAGVELERRDGEQIELGFYGGKKVECYVRLDENSSNRARGRVGGQNTAENGVPERPSISATSRGSKRRRTNTLTRGGASCEAPPGEYSKPSGHAISPQSAVSDHISPNSALSSACESTVFCLSVGDRVRALIPSLGIDLVGFIASAIVFSPRATVSTTQVIRAVLEAQPSLAEAVLAIMPTPTPQQNMNNVDSNAELKAYAVADRLSSAGPNESFQIKTERECCSAPLPSDYPSTEDIDLKPTVPEFKDYPSFGSPSCRSYFEGLPVEDKIDRVVDACRPVILETLNKGWKADGTGMFGCVTNDGLKDASGEPLDSLWYYQPQRDQDLERRGNLQPYVRHIRHTQTTSKQYYFKKVRGSGRRKS